MEDRIISNVELATDAAQEAVRNFADRSGAVAMTYQQWVQLETSICDAVMGELRARDKQIVIQRRGLSGTEVEDLRNQVLEAMVREIIGGAATPAGAIMETQQPAPKTFAELETWLAPQIGRNCIPDEARAYVGFATPSSADTDSVMRVQFTVMLIRGDTEQQAVEGFIAELPVVFPGTDRFLVRSPLEIAEQTDFDTGKSEFRIRFRAARVPEWCFTAKRIEP